MTWERGVAVVVVIGVAALVAKLVDRRMARRELAPEAVTRYRVIRRSVMTVIIFIGVLSALLAIPQVRAIAGGILASSAVVGLVVGFAAQRTLSNFIAGVLIAFTQPLRLGDRVAVADGAGIVEEIGLTYTFIRLDDRSRLVIPNDKLASDTIRNSTIVSREKVAEITLQVPLTHDLGAVVSLLRQETAGERDSEVIVSGLDGNATLTVRAHAADELRAEQGGRVGLVGNYCNQHQRGEEHQALQHVAVRALRPPHPATERRHRVAVAGKHRQPDLQSGSCYRHQHLHERERERPHEPYQLRFHGVFSPLL
jgi:hypothetical protein